MIFFLGSFYSHKLRAPKRNYSDFHCYYVTGKRLLAQENIYIVQDKEIAEFRYAPIFALLMSGMGLWDENTADTIWYITNFCLLVISFILLKRIIAPGQWDNKSVLILYGLTILGALRFILHNFDTGQTNILMFSSIIIGLYYILKRREVLGGAILAFSAMIKYTPIIFVPYFILRRKIKLSLVILASIATYLILPALFIGLKDNIAYMRNLIPFLTHSSILDRITVLDPENQSLLSFFYRIFTYCISYFHAPPMPFQSLNLKEEYINLIFILSAIILYSLILYQPQKTHPKKLKHINNIDYALLLICVALFNLNAWMHNFIFLSFGYFILVYYLIKDNFKDKIVSIFLALSYILNIITMKPILGKIWAYKLHFYSPYTLSALITFFLLLKIKFSKARQP